MVILTINMQELFQVKYQIKKLFTALAIHLDNILSIYRGNFAKDNEY